MTAQNLINWTQTLMEYGIPMQTSKYLEWYDFSMTQLPPSFAVVIQENLEHIHVIG